ncbi:hypothetical protein V6N13_051030 [Hibiscus sabdariffa]|uniref:Uncharacterized protein n=1 Tax=Hibiscus sabdariffa TaxID=183260 RepID=A0ABR2T316_9ROSI
MDKNAPSEGSLASNGNPAPLAPIESSGKTPFGPEYITPRSLFVALAPEEEVHEVTGDVTKSVHVRDQQKTRTPVVGATTRNEADRENVLVSQEALGSYGRHVDVKIMEQQRLYSGLVGGKIVKPKGFSSFGSSVRGFHLQKSTDIKANPQPILHEWMQSFSQKLDSMEEVRRTSAHGPGTQGMSM